MNKTDLCCQFIKLPDDDDNLLSIVEKISGLKDITINCVYKCKTPCTRKATTLFGLCSAHLSTTRGEQLKDKWNATIDQLADESVTEKSEEVTIDKSSESSEEESLEPTVETPTLETPTVEPTVDENGIKSTPGEYHIRIIKTKSGHHIHEQSRLVFNMKTQKAVGKLSADNKIYALEDADIEFCERYAIKYQTIF